MKKILLFVATLCGLTSFAVEPVAVWSGDFNTTTKGDYTLSSNGNTVAADGSSITISTTATKGVLVDISPALTTGKTTLIVKYSGLSTPSSNAVLLSGAMNNQIKDLVGVAVKTDGSISNIWDNNADSRGSVDSSVAVPQAGIVAFTYDGNNSTASNKGGAFYVKTASGMARKAQSLGSLFSTGNPVNGFAIGGKRASGSLGVIPGLVIEGVAIFDSVLSTTDMAEYEFPKVAKKNESVLLLNFGKSNPTGWVTCNEMSVGGNIPQTGTLSQEGSSATFRIAGGGNFFNEDNKDFDLVTNGTFSNGTYRGTDGKDYETIEAEVKASLGLADNVAFDSSVYGCGLQNGGFADHTATIGGLDATAKYIVYVGYGMHKSNQCAGFKITSDQCSSVDSIDYVTTVAGTGTSVANAYTAATVGTELRPGENGLLIVRLTNVVPTSSGEIKFAPHGERSGINFLAVAKVNETEEPEEEETITYPATGFVTKTYQQTGWKVTIDDILQYGMLMPTMSGGYMANRPVEGSARFITKTTESGASVLSAQMQVVNDGHLKVVEVYLKDSDNGILIKATRAGHTTGAALGTNQTSFGDQVAENANADGYGVASVSLSITKPVDKSVKGTIGEVTTAHSEDYTSNTITAKVTIENEGEYKGEAVLVYMLDEKQYTGEITEGSAAITVAGLTQEKVYRGTLVLGQKIGEDVTVIEGTEQPVALYQGERQYTWMASPIVIKKKGTINVGEGCTVPIPTDMPDYVENCDSEYTVSISASEAVNAGDDDKLIGDEQGGVRIANTDEGLKLQVLTTCADAVGSGWVDLADAELETKYVVNVHFHYAKNANERTKITYTCGETSMQSDNQTDKTKVTEVFIADGTVLPADLTGLFQFDSAVIVDIEIEPGDEVVGIEADNDVEAQKIAAKLKVGISEAVAAVMKTAAQQDAYRAYFKIIAVKAEDGTYTAQVVFADGVEDDIEKDIADAIDDVVESFNTGAAVKIAAKPGLYYGVKRGESPDKLDVEETTLATSENVTISITKPDTSKSHFYRIIVSPTPAAK